MPDDNNKLAFKANKTIKMKCFEQITQKLKTPIWSIYEQKFIERVILPCGKCAACINRRIQEWTFRLDNERINSAVTYFVTLTYNNYHVPINRYGKMELQKEHVQQFLKKLRYDHDNDPEYGIFEDHYFKCNLRNEKIKYYAVGEYGTERKRPHYHLVMYNTGKKSIEDNWEYGEVDIQIPKSSQAIGYVIKYLHKRIYNITPKNVKPEFSLMSKGIGLGYVEKMKTWHKKNLDILYTSNESTTKVPMSRFYREKLFTEKERSDQIPIIKNNIETNERDQIKKYGEAGARHKQDQKERVFLKRQKSKVRRRADPGAS